MRTARSAAVVLATVSVLAASSGAGSAQTAINPHTGPDNAITDVDGVEVGHYTRIGEGYLTGSTVVMTRDGAIGGVDVRGGGPGTRETDLLDPRNLVHRVHAISLSGGSAYGLEAATGVMQYLEEEGIGYGVGGPGQVVPIVPGAIIFDLNRGGEFTARPTAEFGYEAASAAATGPFDQGTVGAGTGASAGGLKGGVGTASVDLGNGITVGAIAVVNAVGSTYNPVNCELYGAWLELDDEFGDYQAPSDEECEDAGGGSAYAQVTGSETNSLNTTIGVIATNVPLTKAQASKMAGIAHDGMARAIRPSHTLLDGDTLFALSTGKGSALAECQEANVFPSDFACALVLNDVYAAGADAFTRAVAHAMLNAETAEGIISYCDTFPSANCGGGGGSTGGADGGANGGANGNQTDGGQTDGGQTEGQTQGQTNRPPDEEPPPGAPNVPTPVTGGSAVVFLAGGALLMIAFRRRRQLT